MKHTFPEELKNYENKWVALSEDTEKILGVGNDAVEALNDAKEKGYSEVVLYKVLPNNAYYIGSL
jgi:Family of unknown function (DUF5678)